MKKFLIVALILSCIVLVAAVMLAPPKPALAATIIADEPNPPPGATEASVQDLYVSSNCQIPPVEATLAYQYNKYCVELSTLPGPKVLRLEISESLYNRLKVGDTVFLLPK